MTDPEQNQQSWFTNPARGEDPATSSRTEVVDEAGADHSGTDDSGEDWAEWGEPGRRRGAKRRSAVGCLAALVALAIICGAVIFGASKFMGWVKENFSNPADYPGPGHGKVLFEVHKGDNAEDMADDLLDQGVIESWQAFVDAARANPESSSIQVGWYPLKKEMNSGDVLDVLTDPDQLIVTKVTIPEGLRVNEIVNRLSEATGFPKAKFDKALADPASIGLPAYAGGNPEGYLFPATYDFGPKAKPVDMLSQMIDRFEQALGDNDIEKVAANLGPGYSAEQIMTVASLLEAEANNTADMAKMSRAIYNRLEMENGGGTFGYLQIDATILYALNTRDPGVLIEPLADLTDSPFNTYRYPGLPPSPIGSPGEAAIQAALRPANGAWLYWVTVDCDGTTIFSNTLSEHNSHTPVTNCS